MMKKWGLEMWGIWFFYRILAWFKEDEKFYKEIHYAELSSQNIPQT